MERARGVAPAPSYRVLFGVPGFGRLAGGLVLGRIGDAMWGLVLVLFVLTRFHSPALAGISLLAAQVPGKIVSPLAGALLDRYGRTVLVVLDYAVAAVFIGAIAALDAGGDLTPTRLVIALVIAGTTQPLSMTGLRSLFPILVPRRLWDRANAVDSGAFVFAGLIGPALGGAIVGLFGARAGVLSVAVTFAAAAAVTLGVPRPAAPVAARDRLLHSTWSGLRYVVANPTLRGLAIVISLLNVGGGVMLVGIPVLVQRNLAGNPALTGLIFAGFGLAGLVSTFVSGRVGSEGRERWFLVAGNILFGIGLLTFAIGGPLPLVVVAALLAGAGTGPCDIGLFALRQRRTDAHMLGRALAVSMALNSLGIPIGSALAGVLLSGTGTAVVFMLGALFAFLGVALVPLVIPRHGPATVRRT